MANAAFVLALERKMELVPLRRGWWVAQTGVRRPQVARTSERIIQRLPKEALMIGGGGAA